MNAITVSGYSLSNATTNNVSQSHEDTAEDRALKRRPWVGCWWQHLLKNFQGIPKTCSKAGDGERQERQPWYTHVFYPSHISTDKVVLLQGTKTYVGVELYLHVFLTSALYVVASGSPLSPLYSSTNISRYTFNRRLAGIENTNNSCRIRTTIPQTCSF